MIPKTMSYFEKVFSLGDRLCSDYAAVSGSSDDSAKSCPAAGSLAAYKKHGHN
jgi:hypothetical protein